MFGRENPDASYSVCLPSLCAVWTCTLGPGVAIEQVRLSLLRDFDERPVRIAGQTEGRVAVPLTEEG